MQAGRWRHFVVRITAMAALVLPQLLQARPSVPVAPPSIAAEPAPEAASLYRSGLTSVSATRDMVVAAHPLAAAAGREILDAGGSAVDAAIAVQMVLGLVEPQSSGVAGGAFLLAYDRRSARVRVYDGREVAPAGADERLFLHADGSPMAFHEAVVGGRSVGVPGVLRMLELAHRQHGRLPWKRLFDPAIRLARTGFEVTPRLNLLLAGERYLALDAPARALFYPDGRALPVGARLVNAAYADTLERIAAGGADAFYRGPIAAAIVAKVTRHRNAGTMTLDDLARYRAIERDAVCIELRRWRVCGVPPPSSGGIAVAQVLAMLESREVVWPQASRAGTGEFVWSAAAVHWIGEAERLAFADRALYVADPAFVPVDVQGLTAPGYLAARAALIGPRSLGVVKAGQPRGTAVALAADPSPMRTATSQVSIVDADGNAISMTTTIEDQFGARLMVDGFLLNNQLTDFSFLPTVDGLPVANRVAAGKRPRSTMAPTLVFDRRDGTLVAVLGAPGGSQIVEYVVKTLIGTLEMDLDVQRAIDSANFGSRNGPTELEQGRFPPAVIDSLESRGHVLSFIEMTSGTQAIVRDREPGHAPRWIGGADARREGTVSAGR
ncbi:gamma-glutamyltransferase [soil metagenome]